MKKLFTILLLLCSVVAWGQNALVREYLAKAQAGNATYQYIVGLGYETGTNGFNKDLGKAQEYYVKAATKRYEPAMFSLGLYYKDINKDEAIYWFKKYMDEWYKKYGKENETAAEYLCEFGVEYHPGDNENSLASNSSVPIKTETTTASNISSTQANSQSYKELDVNTLKSKADSGDAEAQWELGWRYFYGHIDQQRNISLGVSWMKLAAELITKGHAAELGAIGKVYEDGEGGITPNKNEAIKWYKKSAELSEKGSASSANSLGFIYDDIDKAEAIFWYVRALDLVKAYPTGDDLIDGLDAEEAKMALDIYGITYDPEKSNLTANFRNYTEYKNARGSIIKSNISSEEQRQWNEFIKDCTVADNLLKNKDYKNAIKEYDKIIKKKYPFKMLTQVYYGRGLANYNLGKWKKAMEDLEITKNMTYKTNDEIYRHCTQLWAYANYKREEAAENRARAWASVIQGVANATANAYAYSQGISSAYVPTYNNPIVKVYSAPTFNYPNGNGGYSLNSFIDNTSYSDISTIVQGTVNQVAPMINQQALNDAQTFNETLEKQKNNIFDSFTKNAWDNVNYAPIDADIQNSGVGNIGGGIDGNISSGNSTTTSPNREGKRHDCPLCRGRKRIAKESYQPTFGQQDTQVYCSECGRSWMRSTGHHHIDCPQCHGMGYFTTN